LNLLAVLIKHRSHSTVLQTRENDIALLQGALLNQQRRDSASALVQS
jgi:hypothetical protein